MITVGVVPVPLPRLRVAADLRPLIPALPRPWGQGGHPVPAAPRAGFTTAWPTPSTRASPQRPRRFRLRPRPLALPDRRRVPHRRAWMIPYCATPFEHALDLLERKGPQEGDWDPFSDVVTYIVDHRRAEESRGGASGLPRRVSPSSG
jgi:hypothetical protein